LLFICIFVRYLDLEKFFDVINVLHEIKSKINLEEKNPILLLNLSKLISKLILENRFLRIKYKNKIYKP